jgi:hypothetical protein
LAGLIVATFTVSLATAPAFACKGTKVLFEDNFDDPNDDSWGTSLGEQMEIGNGKLVLKPKENWVLWPYFQGSLFDDIDMCVTAKVSNIRGEAFGGLAFWRTPNTSDFYMLGYFANGGVKIARHQKDKWLMVKSLNKGDVRPGENGLRVTLKGNNGTAYLNDKQIFTFKGVNQPDGAAIGFYAQSADWEFSRLRVTTPPGN